MAVGIIMGGIYAWYLISVLMMTLTANSGISLPIGIHDDGHRKLDANGPQRFMLRSNLVSQFETESLLSEGDPMTQHINDEIDYGHMTEIMLKMRKRTFREWKSSSWFYIILYFLELPIKLLIQLTVPPVESPMYNPNQKYIYSFTTPFAFLLSRGIASSLH